MRDVPHTYRPCLPAAVGTPRVTCGWMTNVKRRERFLEWMFDTAVVLLIAGCVAFVAGFAMGCTYDPESAADDDDINPDATVVVPDGATPDLPPAVFFSQTNSQDPEVGDSRFCPATATRQTADNAWSRVFKATEHLPSLLGPFHITHVYFSSEVAKGSPDVTVSIYDYAGVRNDILLSSFGNQMAQAHLTVADNASLQGLAVDIDTVVGPNQLFVVEIASADTAMPDGTPIQTFHLGENQSDETAKNYWKSSACSQNVPASQFNRALIMVEGFEVQ